MSDFKMKPTIFREYDVRGVAEQRFRRRARATLLGQAVGTRLRARSAAETPLVAVGRDCRLTSPRLCARR